MESAVINPSGLLALRDMKFGSKRHWRVATNIVGELKMTRKPLIQIAALLMSVLFVGQSFADPLDITDINGFWNSAITDEGPELVTYLNDPDPGDTDRVEWGVGYQQPLPSAYTFTPAGDITGITVPPSFIFALGVFAHENNPLRTDSPWLESIVYSLTFNTNGVPSPVDIQIDFEHDETPNGGLAPACCADIVNVSTSNPDTLITVTPLVGDPMNYFFNLLGWATDDSCSDAATTGLQFSSPEGGTNSRVLCAEITDAPRVPEPGLLGLLGLGLLGLGVTRMRKQG